MCFKNQIIKYIRRCNKIEADRKKSHILSLARINTQVEQDLFRCLIDLLLHFDEQTDALEEETGDCFEQCARIVGEPMDKVRDVESSGADEGEESK